MNYYDYVLNKYSTEEHPELDDFLFRKAVRTYQDHGYSKSNIPSTILGHKVEIDIVVIVTSVLLVSAIIVFVHKKRKQRLQ